MGEGRGGPPATWEVSVGRSSERGVIQQRAHTLNPPPYQHCISNQLRFAKLYTRPNLSARVRNSGCSLLGNYSHRGWWVWDDSSLSVGSDKRHVYMRQACFVIWHRHSFTASRPSLHFPGAAAQPQPRGVISTELQHSRIKCVIHADCCVTFEYSTSVDIWNSRIEK